MKSDALRIALVLAGLSVMPVGAVEPSGQPRGNESAPFFLVTTALSTTPGTLRSSTRDIDPFGQVYYADTYSNMTVRRTEAGVVVQNFFTHETSGNDAITTGDQRDWIDPVTDYVVMNGTSFNWSVVDGGTPYSRKVIGAPTSGWVAPDGAADVIYAGKGNDFADGGAGQAGISSLRKIAIASMSDCRHSIRNKARFTSRIFHDSCKRKDAASFDSRTGGAA